jgi:thymidylate synthase
MSTLYASFSAAIERAEMAMQNYSRPVHTDKWQGIDISKRPEAEMREVIGWDFRVAMAQGHSEEAGLDYFREQIKPNLPFADVHFEERVCGYPMNPGEAWKIWPWAQSAGEFRDEKGRFEINYMERFWAAGHFEDTPTPGVDTPLLTGIRGRKYGDLGSIVELLSKDPLTRQAYLPVFFPEDTGAGGRIPCTLGYHWIMRGGFLHVHYPIRSCDFFRHFRDDIYLAVRLTIWLLDQLREANPKTWDKVHLGYYSMWIGSLHLFINDYAKLFGRPKAD